MYRAEVVRVGDAVEDDQQRRSFDIFQHLVERLRQRHRLDAGDHALMLGGLAHQSGQPVGINLRLLVGGLLAHFCLLPDLDLADRGLEDFFSDADCANARCMSRAEFSCSTRLKSILLVSMSACITLMRTRSPRRYFLPVRSPSIMCLAWS